MWILTNLFPQVRISPTYPYINVSSRKLKKCRESMQCIIWCWRGKMEEYQFTNTSLAIFPTKMFSLLYSDPYNNTFGEKNWLVILFVIFSTICCIVSIYLMIGIVIFGSFSCNINRTFIDRVSKQIKNAEKTLFVFEH